MRKKRNQKSITLSEEDRSILKTLRGNKTRTLYSIRQITGIPAKRIHERLIRMRDRGVVTPCNIKSKVLARKFKATSKGLTILEMENVNVS